MTQHHISEDFNLQLQDTSAYFSGNHEAFTLISVKLTLCSSSKSALNVGGFTPEDRNVQVRMGHFFPRNVIKYLTVRLLKIRQQ
jgi:hypothetical protein